MAASAWSVTGGAASKQILAADYYRDEVVVQLHETAVEGAGPVFLGFGEDATTETGIMLGGIGHTVRVLGAKARLAVNALSSGNASGGIETHTSLEYRHTLNYPIWQKYDPVQGTPPTLIHTDPADDETGVLTTFDPFVMLFDMNVVANAGVITIFTAADDMPVESVNIADATVDGGTAEFSLVAPLTPATAYYIRVANDVLRSEDGTAWPGITDTTTWSFTTGML